MTSRFTQHKEEANFLEKKFRFSMAQDPSPCASKVYLCFTACKFQCNPHRPLMGKATVLYNDKCPVCSFEIEHYKRLCSKRGLDLDFEKISTAGPVLTASRLTVEDAKKRLHLVTSDGRLVVGVEAFLALWAEMPGYRVLGRVVSIPVIHHLASLLYDRAVAPTLFWLDRRRKGQQRG